MRWRGQPGKYLLDTSGDILWHLLYKLGKVNPPCRVWVQIKLPMTETSSLFDTIHCQVPSSIYVWDTFILPLILHTLRQCPFQAGCNSVSYSWCFFEMFIQKRIDELKTAGTFCLLTPSKVFSLEWLERLSVQNLISAFQFLPPAENQQHFFTTPGSSDQTWTCRTPLSTLIWGNLGLDCIQGLYLSPRKCWRIPVSLQSSTLWSACWIHAKEPASDAARELHGISWNLCAAEAQSGFTFYVIAKLVQFF